MVQHWYGTTVLKNLTLQKIRFIAYRIFLTYFSMKNVEHGIGTGTVPYSTKRSFLDGTDLYVRMYVRS